MAQLKYLDLTGLQTFWTSAKKYIDDADNLKVAKTDIANNLNGGTSKVLSAEQGKVLKGLIDNVTAGQLTVPVATDAKVGGVKSGGDITVAGDGAVTVNSAAQATRLATEVAIAVSGAVKGAANFDGSKGITISTTLADHTHEIADVTGLQGELDLKAPLASPNLTGTPTAPTAGSGTSSNQIATTAFVKAEIDSVLAANQAVEFKGVVNTSTPLPEEGASVGDLYVVGEAGTYAEQECEPGDMILATDADTWYVIQTNINGAVTGPTSAVANNIATFDGATGKIIKDSGITASSVSTAITQAGAANTALAGIGGTVKNYVDTAVSGATLTAGTVTETGTNAITISGKAINITLKAYALASDLDALEALVGSTPVSEQISTAIEPVTTRIDGLEGKINANTAKLADVSTTVGAAIDAKINTAIGDSGVITTWGDARFIQETEAVKITTTEIEGLFTGV